MATLIPVPRPAGHLVESTPYLGASQVPSHTPGLFGDPELQKDLYEEGFGHSLQAAATEFKKL